MSMTIKHWLAAFLTAVLAVLTTPALADETITYIHWDALGSPVAATDEDGNVVWRESYRPYGERIDNDPSASSNSRWYTGHPQDADTGLVYAGARYYDPVIGRFLAWDPVEFQEDNLHSFNRYAYANNNPYAYVDPDGRLPILAPVAYFVVKEAAAEVASRLTGGATDFLSARRAGTRAAKGLGKLFTRNSESVTKKVPNPHGSRGGPAHRSTIDRRIRELKDQGHEHMGGGNLKEELIRTPGGCKSCRRPDITTRAPDGSTYRENVGRSTRSGSAISRERKALDDIEAATGSRPGYTPYDR